MRIKGFHHLIEKKAKPHEMKNCSLVIDAQNFFFECYKKSGLRFEFGAECDRYAKYLKNYLSMFKNANIKCYFIFKGGTKDLKTKIDKARNDGYVDDTYLVDPIFMIDIHLQVLKEMEFDYFFSEYECKADCVTLARKLSCPVLSKDIQFPLSGVQYISKNHLNPQGDHISVKLFTRDAFLQEFKLDIDKLALFVLLTDKLIGTDTRVRLETFLRSRHLHPWSPWRNQSLLTSLSKCPEEIILNDILENTSITDRELLFGELNKLKTLLRGNVNSEVAFDYFFNRSKITDWFVKGVAENNITKEYVDIYRSNVLFKNLYDDVDIIELSLGIIKYVYDLLTDFKNDGLKFICYYNYSKTERSEVIRNSIRKPSYQLDQSIFQNGWDNISSLGLFQHFISETIDFNCDILQNIRDDVKMLMITLIYIHYVSQKLKSNNTMFTAEMAYGVLLSYVILGVVKARIDDDQNDDSVTISDCKSALHSLDEYFNVKKASDIMNKDLLVPLMQFQYCLSEMNYLNKLCGSPFEPTCYRKTYNATFVYKVIYTKKEGIIPFVEDTLGSAPTVLKYFRDIIEVYNNLIHKNN